MLASYTVDLVQNEPQLKQILPSLNSNLQSLQTVFAVLNVYAAVTL